MALGVVEADVPGLDAALREIAVTGDTNNALRLDLAGKLALKTAHPRYEAFLQRAPAFIAAQARQRGGVALADAVTAWDAAARARRRCRRGVITAGACRIRARRACCRACPEAGAS